MSRHQASSTGNARDEGRLAAFPAIPPSRAPWRCLVPGMPQWGLGQRERGWVFLSIYAASALTGLFGWGTWVGHGLLVLAFVVHVLSASEFFLGGLIPGFGKGAVVFTTGGWLAAGLYGPLLGALLLLAWPGMRSEPSREGYLVDRVAYRGAEPRPGDWVWYRPTTWGEPRLGRVVGGAGQEIEWRGNRLTVDGRPADVSTPSRSNLPPAELAYRVPEGHVLVNPEGDRRAPEGVMLLTRDLVVGRAWARMYPVLERGPLR